MKKGSIIEGEYLAGFEPGILSKQLSNFYKKVLYFILKTI